jgi:hypothetical protein
VLYVLDEPSHRPAPARQPPAHRDPDPAARPRQHPHRRRARRGHHRTADWVVDIGPGAGEHGGQVVHCGPVKPGCWPPRVAHRRVPVGSQVASPSPTCAARRSRAATGSVSPPARTTCATSP